MSNVSMNEFQALCLAAKASKKDYPDEIVIVYKQDDGNFSYIVESNYLGDFNKIYNRYLNGSLVQV